VPTVPEKVRCPSCRRLAPWAGNPDRPFCSARCRLLDLGDWVAGRHRIPGESRPDEGESADDAREGEE
jgi:uncharacterized protein